MREREDMMCAIEEAAAAMIREGTCDAWRDTMDSEVKDVVASVNGPLFASLLKKGGYVDAGCVESLRTGGASSVLRGRFVFDLIFLHRGRNV